ncbi:MAG: DNA adenine methylase [Actinomycetes bacterium]
MIAEPAISPPAGRSAPQVPGGDAHIESGLEANVIKYLGSKRTLVPMLGQMATAVGASSAVDLFTGTTRVAQEFKRRSIDVTAVDVATYSELLAKCFIEIDADSIDREALTAAFAELSSLRGEAGYFTETFCERSRFFHPKNGSRIDAIRSHLESTYRGSALFPVLLTSLMLAADRVDSTTGVQMAYLKQWAPRAHKDLELRVPDLIAGKGVALRRDARDAARGLPRVDLAYLDPPYNQHRYFTNYHVWETLVRWDQPEHYGVACKRLDARDQDTKSDFNRKAAMPAALRDVIHAVDAATVVVSYNDESWVTPDLICSWLSEAGHECVDVIAVDSKRYVGAQIGIHNPRGERVGEVKRLRNVEYLFVAGDRDRVGAAVTAASEHHILTR